MSWILLSRLSIKSKPGQWGFVTITRMMSDVNGVFTDDEVRAGALVCLITADPSVKTLLTTRLYAHWQAGELTLSDKDTAERIPVPGRPSKPELVAPRLLSKRSVHNKEGRAALIHALCHIEFNAINLALDAVYRFAGMPSEYYGDWLRVAKEEAYHFELLSEHLRGLGYAYGDFVAHNGLWEMALETDHDVMVRMALVPRVMEARGLDVTPSIMEKLSNAGDNRAVEILGIIQHDEVGHVETGTRWFRYLCRHKNLEPLPTFKALLKKYLKGPLHGPFDHVMRKQAGFTEDELAFLEETG